MTICVQKEKIAEVHGILIEGISGYAGMHGFKKAVVGLSSGIDSAVTCSLATEVFGRDNVLGISMPSKYSSKESEEYAFKLSQNLGIGFKVVPISGIYDSYLDLLEKDLGGNEDKEIEVYHQNIQARIRGNILMAFSNRFGYLVLATGNKSEAMMGYCTLYGDTVGGLAVLSDVYKAGVYALSEYINREKEIIPKEIIERIPSAELKPGQADHHTLPPYDVLDEILYCYIDKGLTKPEIIDRGFDGETVETIFSTIERTAYKRAQCPGGISVSEDVYGL